QFGRASRPAEQGGRGAGLQVRPPRRAQRAAGGDLRQAPPGDRAAAAVADRGDGDRGEGRRLRSKRKWGCMRKFLIVALALLAVPAIAQTGDTSEARNGD